MCIWPPWAWWSPLVVAVIASLFGQPKYYGRPGWERVPTASNRKEVKLGELEKQILEMLRIGHCYMSDLTDAPGGGTPKTSGAAVENLDQGGYLVRAGMSGSKFYTFTITEKGLAALPRPQREGGRDGRGVPEPPVCPAPEGGQGEPRAAGGVCAEKRH